MPDCVAIAWREILGNNLERIYKAGFEIYDERSKDWSDAEVDIIYQLYSFPKFTLVTGDY